MTGSILGRHVIVREHAVVHEDVVIGERSSVAVGTVVGAGARLEPGTLDRAERRRRRVSRCVSSRTPWLRPRRPAGHRPSQALRAVQRRRGVALRGLRERPLRALPAAALPALRERPAIAPRRLQLPRVPRPRSLVRLRLGGLRLRGGGARPRHGLQVPRLSLPCGRDGRFARRPPSWLRVQDRLRRGSVARLRRTSSSPGCRVIATHTLERGFDQAELLARGLARLRASPLRRCCAACATARARAASPGAARAANVARFVRVAGGGRPGTKRVQAGYDS